MDGQLQKLLNDIEAVFTMARMKQIEIAPQDEQALIRIIQLKQEIKEALTKAHNGTTEDIQGH